MAANQGKTLVRGTQLLVEHISEVFRRPSLAAIEIAWRWLFGIPFLLVCRRQVQQILAAYPLDASGAGSIDAQNPWVAATQLSSAATYYAPHVAHVLRWLLPAAAAAWIALSGIGRSFLLHRMGTDRAARMPFRPIAIAALQAAWLVLLAVTLFGWLRSMQWNAAAHFAVNAEPDLIGYFIWAIFLSLGFFTAFALVSWMPAIAAILALAEGRSAFSALGASLRLGKAFTSKLAEVNLVLGIVKLALLVVAMVFSAAPLPFSDELGPGAMRAVFAVSAVFFLVADDFFQVVRLKAFAEFWRIFRKQTAPAGGTASRGG